MTLNTQTRPINDCKCDRCTELRRIGVESETIAVDHKSIRQLGEELEGRIKPKDYVPVMRHGKLDSFRLIETPQPGTPPCEDAYPDKAYFRDDAGNDHEVGHDPVSNPDHDPVSNPDHYTWHPSGVEQIVISEHMPYNLGTAIKYIWRCHHKGKTIEDLQKAKWLIEREIKRVSEMSK
jgi:hypothetical protein